MAVIRPEQQQINAILVQIKTWTAERANYAKVKALASSPIHLNRQAIAQAQSAMDQRTAAIGAGNAQIVALRKQMALNIKAEAAAKAAAIKAAAVAKADAATAAALLKAQTGNSDLNTVYSVPAATVTTSIDPATGMTITTSTDPLTGQVISSAPGQPLPAVPVQASVYNTPTPQYFRYSTSSAPAPPTPQYSQDFTTPAPIDNANSSGYGTDSAGGGGDYGADSARGGGLFGADSAGGGAANNGTIADRYGSAMDAAGASGIVTAKQTPVAPQEAGFGLIAGLFIMGFLFFHKPAKRSHA